MHPTDAPLLLRLSDLTDAPIDWLWPGRLAAGTLALLDGDPGQGKSLLTLDLAARLSMGRPWPDGQPVAAPADVLLLACEDSLQQTVRARLGAAGADLERIHVCQVRSPAGEKRWPTFPDDLPLVAAALRTTGARLVVIDPLLAFLSAGISNLNDQLLRRALDPLAALASEARAAFLLVRHLTKRQQGAGALYRGAGALALIGAARTAFLAGHDATADQHLLACTKNNLGPLAPTLAYRVDETAGQPGIAWLGSVVQTADEIVTQPRTERLPGPLAEALAFLQDVLAHGPTPATAVLRQALAQGIARRTLDRAKVELDVCAERRTEGDRACWFWSLPENTDSQRSVDDLLGRTGT